MNSAGTALAGPSTRIQRAELSMTDCAATADGRLVFTVEPIIAVGSGEPKDGGDGWTVKTADGSLSAHFEHTIVITDGAPMLLTAA